MANHISHAGLPYPIKKCAYTWLVPFLNASGTPTDPTAAFDTEISKDGGAFANCTNTSVDVITGGRGGAFHTLTGTEMDCTAAIVYAFGDDPEGTLATFYPYDGPIIGSGTLSAGSAGGGTIGTIIPVDISGAFIRLLTNTGAGQARRILTYATSAGAYTGAFTVSPNWETTPGATTTYDIMLPKDLMMSMFTRRAGLYIKNDSGVLVPVSS